MAPRMRRKGREPSLDLPSLFPAHDGSYGINTLINIDTESKKGHKENPGIAKEQLDDGKWAESMKGNAARKYGMNSNLKKAIVESHEKVEKEHRSQSSGSPDRPHVSNMNVPGSSGPPPGSSQVSEHRDDRSTQLTPHVPEYNPNKPPFLEAHDDHPRPPYKPAGIPSYNPLVPSGTNQTASPPSEHIPFYGMPNGKGSNEPISPTRPDSPRSFNGESGLFADAMLRTPPSIDMNIPPITAQGLSLAPQTQSTGWVDSTGVYDVGKQHAGGWQARELPKPQEQPTAGQPNTRQSIAEEFAAKQPAMGQLLTAKSLPYGRPDARKPPEPLKPPERPKASEVKIAETRTSNLYSKDRPQQPGNSPLENTNAFRQRQNPLLNRSHENWRLGWVWQSSDLIITSLVMFAVLVITVWVTLSAIPSDSGESHLRLCRVNLGLPDFSTGTIWERISNLLPEIPDIESVRRDNFHNLPDAPRPSGRKDVDEENLIEKLSDSIPDAVWVQKEKNGNLKIAEDFWHALKEKNKQDNIFSLGSANISDDFWRSIKSRMRADGLEAGMDRSVDDPKLTRHVEDVVNKKLSQSWESWLKQNDQALSQPSTGAKLTKDDFIKLCQQEIASYQREIKTELTEQQERIKSLTQQLSRLRDEVSADTASKQEISEVIDTMVSQAIRNAKLDAIAQGRIKGHANDVLANQVDFFGRGGGGVIDPKRTSKVWKFPKEPITSKNYIQRAYHQESPNVVLLPWFQEGDCHCVKPDPNGAGQGTISVVLSRRIIPQHFVVEHILPGATLRPGATPKDIEVWAYIEEINLRNEMQAFSEAQFPDTPKEKVLNEGFVKIGHFTYERKDYGDGVQIFKLSDQLSRMKAITNQIVVRAVTNYGADHTCFYQLKMYGKAEELPEHVPPPPPPPKGWFRW
ncbi:hypothetical protein GGR50DRAFT_386075 [Xylaria sp. CBS 124048]|nr:hypothetical protein GGR50DRAFT_386075 [Xylaria sp. CBS 124048]